MEKNIRIFLINCDWRDLFRTSFVELHDKLERDRLNATQNDFFIFSWSRVNYSEKKDKFYTIHKKTRLDLFRPLLDLYSFIRVPKILKDLDKKPEVWVTYDFGFLPTLWRLQKIHGGKIVMCINNQPRVYSKTRRFGSIKYWYSWLIEKLFKGIPEQFFTINDTMKTYLTDMGISESKIKVFSMNTIDRDREFIDKAQMGTIKKRYNLPADSKVLLTVARLEAEKNYPVLLQNFSHLPKNFYLFALGRGSLMASLIEKCKELGIQDRVFFPGFVHRDDIWNFYKDTDVFVLLSKAEALGVVFWEAMSQRIPVIGSDVDGILETIGKDGERGRIWTADKGVGGFVSIVNECIAETPEKEKMLDMAQQFVAERMNNKITINDLV